MPAEINTMIEIFNMFQVQYSQVDKLWNYFGVISLAVAGFTIGSEKATRTIWEPVVIVIGYLSFCVGNYQALINGHSFLIKLAEKYNDLAIDQKLNYLEIHSIQEITKFYFLVVVTFTVAIIIVSISRLKSHNKLSKKDAETRASS